MKTNRWMKMICLGLVVVTFVTGCGKSDLGKKTSQNEKQAPVTAIKEVNKDIPEEYKETVKMLNNVREYKMPYFGGYTLKDKQVVLFSDNNDKAIIWNVDKTGYTKIVNKSDLPQDKLMSSFADGELNGTKTVYVMQEDPDRTFILAVHEGYHFYGQEWLNKIQSNYYIPRGNVYPENVDARVYMNAADYQLRQMMEGKNQDGAKVALYFIQEARKNHPQDVEGNLSTALAEGTANFMENLYLAVAKNPAIMNQPKEVAKAAYALNKNNIQGDVHDKGMEYYQIASLPLFYLAMNGHDDIANKLLDGGHPMELLSHLVKAQEASVSPAIKSQVEKMYQSNNEKFGKYVEAFKAKANNQDYVKVSIHMNAFPGSMQFGDFINYDVQGQFRTLATGTTADAKLESGVIAKLSNADTMNSEDYQYTFAYVKKDQVKIDGNQITIKSDTLNVNGAKFEKTDNGYIIK